MSLTEEQKAIVDSFATGASLRVIAYAGTGKTYTLKQMSQTVPRLSGTYLAFNKSIAVEASKKFGPRVDCRTAHSMAWRTVASNKMPVDKMTTALNNRVVRQALREGSLSGERMAPLVAATIRRYCHSSKAVMDISHVPKLQEEALPEMLAYILTDAQNIWDRARNPKDSMPLGHDGYLKLWALGRPKIQSDYLMVDEAQDLNPVLVQVIRRQECQTILVGDPYQQIYAWRGAVDALDRSPGERLRLTQSFRFGENIATFATSLLRSLGETAPCKGNSDIKDEVTDPGHYIPDVLLCRSNAAVIAEAVKRAEANMPFHVVGGCNELLIFLDDVERLCSGQPAISNDLLGFTAWEQVQEASREEGNENLRVLVDLVDRHGPKRLQNVIRREGSAFAREGGLTISTCHKAKGLEWPVVRISSDFKLTVDSPPEEWRLMYVASTRAIKVLMVDKPIGVGA